MLRSNIDEVSGQQFPTKVTKAAEGDFVATAKTVPELGEFRDRTLPGAAKKLNDALATYVANGYKVKK